MTLNPKKCKEESYTYPLLLSGWHSF